MVGGDNEAWNLKIIKIKLDAHYKVGYTPLKESESMFHEHVLDSIEVIAEYKSIETVANPAYSQLVKLTKAAAKICNIDYEQELAKVFEVEEELKNV